MDDPKLHLPPWLPWATTACLAALVACLGELWIIERMRSELLRDQGALAAAALQGVENQLEAERILDRSERAGLHAGAPFPPRVQVALLLAVPGSPGRPAGPACGAVAWDAMGRRGELILAGPPEPAPARDYQLWLEGPGEGFAADCGVLHVPAASMAITLPAVIPPGCRFLLVDAGKGGAPTLGEAEAAGPIVLATLPIGGKISGR